MDADSMLKVVYNLEQILNETVSRVATLETKVQELTEELNNIQVANQDLILN